jgi:AhpD family alkylhydroperoxidase
MPRIQPVGRSRLDPERQTLLKTISGGESRWNVFEGIANHPATLSDMDGLRKAIDDRLTTLEQEVIAIEIARFNGCGYCLPAHRYLCSEIGVDQTDIDAMTRGELLEQQP